jgi:hypothetical protein
MNVTESPGVALTDRKERHRKLLKHAQWRTEVEVRLRELSHRLDVAIVVGPPAEAQQPFTETVEAVSGSTRVTVSIEQAGGAGRPSMTRSERASHVAAIEEALEDARRAIDCDSSISAWLTGTAVTMAWESVHEAEGELVEIESEDVVRASLPRLLTWLREVVTDHKLLERYEVQLTAFMDNSKPLDRTVVRQAHHAATFANNERHAALRTFRNLLIAAISILAMLLIVLAAWHALNPHFVSLCGTGPGAASSAATSTVNQCLNGSTPTGRDLAEIEIVGAIGGLLSVAFALGSSTEAPSRYNVRAPQAALKPVAGAATALAGVLLVQSRILVAPPEGVSEALMLAYAFLFGFSQQLLTQFVDKRAGKLLEPESKPA